MAKKSTKKTEASSLEVQNSVVNTSNQSLTPADKERINRLKLRFPDMEKLEEKYTALKYAIPTIRTEKSFVRPLIYNTPMVYEDLSRSTSWMFKTIEMLKDKEDYAHNMLPHEKSTIGSILKGFAQTETFVCDYWGDFIRNVFPVYEIIAMCRNFSDREIVHSEAYNALNELVNEVNYAEFTREPGIAEKLDLLTDLSHFQNVKAIDNVELSHKIGCFAALEGACLMPSFSVLMSFNCRIKNLEDAKRLPEGIPTKRLKGITSQMTWSVRDELLHARGACWIFNQLCTELAEYNLREFVKEDVREGMMLIYSAELDYLNKIFENGDLPTISKAEVKNLVMHRMEVIWHDLGYDEFFFGEDLVSEELLKDMKWFFEEIGSQKYNDNFDRHNTDYNEVSNFRPRLFSEDTINKIFSHQELDTLIAEERDTSWDVKYEAAYKYSNNNLK